MNNNLPDAELSNSVRISLAKQVDAIDDNMLARLRRARVAAVSSGQQGGLLQRLWNNISMSPVLSAPVAQASVAMLVAVFSISLVLMPPPLVSKSASSGVDVQQNGRQALSEMDVLMSNEDMEFLENLEIYEWLVAEYG